jgi:hypothetical protein
LPQACINSTIIFWKIPFASYVFLRISKAGRWELRRKKKSSNNRLRMEQGAIKVNNL